MIVDVIVAVDVIDTVIVAVHVHGNDAVIVIRHVERKLDGGSDATPASTSR